MLQLPTGYTGPFTGPFTGPHHHFFHIGRKMLGDEAKANHLDKLKKLLPTGLGLPTGHFNSETLHAEHWHKETLDKLKKLLPTGQWSWDAESHDAEGQYFLPKNKINKLKKLLPTGHWLWDPEVQSLSTTDDKTFFLHHHKHLLPTVSTNFIFANSFYAALVASLLQVINKLTVYYNTLFLSSQNLQGLFTGAFTGPFWKP